MAELRDIIGYVCQKYPHKSELSKARLTKMVYLADWRSALKRGKQLSSIKWVYNHYGPYVDDVVEVALTDNAFGVNTTTNAYGSTKDVVKLKRSGMEFDLTKAEREILDDIIRIVSPLYWNKFIELVYSTYPIMQNDRYSSLNLVRLADDYRSSQ
jgi:hypothetical protein